MKEEISEYLRKLDEHTVGAIWLSTEKPDVITPMHEVFNYLVDGQVIKFLDYAKENDSNFDRENMFFIGKNFGNPFIVFNSPTSKDFSQDDFKDFKMILERFEGDNRNKLAVLHPEDYPIPKAIKNDSFEVISITY